MLSRTRRLAGVAAAALAISAGMPATTAGAATAPCVAVSHSNGSEATVVLAGQYVDQDGGDVTLTCHLVQNGAPVVSVSDPLYGPVAALASAELLQTPFTVCYEVSIHHINPWGPYQYYSNC